MAAPHFTVPKHVEDLPTEIDLKRMFPLSCWFPMRFTFKYLVELVFAWAFFEIVLNLAVLPYFTEELFKSAAYFGRWTLVALTCAWVIRYFVAVLRRRCREYWIRDGSLVVSKGIILRRTGTFALSRITDTYIERTVADLFFGTATVNISTPTQISGDFVKLVGFSKNSAEGMQHYLRELTQLISQNQNPASFI